MMATKVTLGEVAELTSGFAFKSQQFLDGNEEGVYLLRGDNVQQGYIRWGDKAKKWRQEDYDELRRYQLQKDDVILAMDRPIVGGGLKLAWIKDQDLPSLLVQRVCRIRGMSGVARTNYLRYALSAPEFVAYLDRITTGANIPHISGRDISCYEFSLPNLDDQDRIVEALCAYDDLIANNQRRISLLEESASLLFREWFVKFRYAGTSEGGTSCAPRGWATVPLGEVAIVNRASLNAKDTPENIQYIDIAAVSAGFIREGKRMQFREAPGRARRLVQHGDVIWSCVRPNLRSYALLWEPDEDIVVSTGFAVLTASHVPFSYLYFATTTTEFVSYLCNVATGAAYPAVSSKDFEDAPMLLPSMDVLQAFDERCLPLLAQSKNLTRQNAHLAKARSSLLPRLLSGGVTV
jgi:type I restriction enzyme S subunit